MFTSLAAGVASAGMIVNACGGDDSNPVTPTTDAAMEAMTAPDVIPDVTGNFHDSVEGGGLWEPTILMLNLGGQPNAMFNPDGGTEPVDPGITVPFVQVTNNASFRGTPIRPPDVAIPSLLPDLGCLAYKFTSVDPRNPKGPGLTDGDMGNVVISGYSGGFIFGPTGPSDASMAPTINCQRNEFFPGADAGLFGYGCDQPQAPVTGFMKATDTVVTEVEGGKDVKGWGASMHPSEHENFNVATPNLWSIAPGAVDGTADLVINYDCGGVACSPTAPNASVVAVVIQSTDARTPGNGGSDAGPGDPFEFGDAKKEFGLIVCQEYLGFNPSSYTVKKELLAQIPPTWSDLRVVVATAAAHQAADPTGQHTVVALGPAKFGITHR